MHTVLFIFPQSLTLFFGQGTVKYQVGYTEILCYVWRLEWLSRCLRNMIKSINCGTTWGCQEQHSYKQGEVEDVKIRECNNARVTHESGWLNTWSPGWVSVKSLLAYTYLTTNKHLFHEVLAEKVLQLKEAFFLFTYFWQLFLSNYHLPDLCSLFILFSTGQRDDTISSESRRCRHNGEESHCPKAANGAAIGLSSVSRSSYESSLALPKLVSEVNQELLSSGAVILPGRGQVIGTQLILASLCDTTACLASYAQHSIVLYCAVIVFHLIKNVLKSSHRK